MVIALLGGKLMRKMRWQFPFGDYCLDKGYIYGSANSVSCVSICSWSLLRMVHV